MAVESIRIEGPPEDLAQLRRELLDEAVEGVEIQAVTTAVPGELREPILTGVVITAAITTLGPLLERFMAHRERMERLRMSREDSDKEISLADIRSEEAT